LKKASPVDVVFEMIAIYEISSVVLFQVGLPSSFQDSAVSKIFPALRYFAESIGADARRRRRSARAHSMTRMESSADNFASGCNTTYLRGGIFRFSITVAMAVRSIR
jgi:hypothetical protein